MISPSEVKKRLDRLDSMSEMGAAMTILLGVLWFNKPVTKLDELVVEWARRVVRA